MKKRRICMGMGILFLSAALTACSGKKAENGAADAGVTEESIQAGGTEENSSREGDPTPEATQISETTQAAEPGSESSSATEGQDADEPVYNEETDSYLNRTLKTADRVFSGQKVSDFNVSGITEENSCLQLENADFTSNDGILLGCRDYILLFSNPGKDIVTNLGIDDNGALRTMTDSDFEVYIEPRDFDRGQFLLGLKDSEGIFAAELDTAYSLDEDAERIETETDGLVITASYYASQYDGKIPDKVEGYYELPDGNYLVLRLEAPTDMERAAASIEKLLSYVTVYNEGSGRKQFQDITDLNGEPADLSAYANIRDLTAVAVLNAYGFNVGNSEELQAFEAGSVRMTRDLNRHCNLQTVALAVPGIADELMFGQELQYVVKDSKEVAGVTLQLMGLEGSELLDSKDVSVNVYIPISDGMELRVFLSCFGIESLDMIYDLFPMMFEKIPSSYSRTEWTPNYGYLN